MADVTLSGLWHGLEIAAGGGGEVMVGEAFQKTEPQAGGLGGLAKLGPGGGSLEQRRGQIRRSGAGAVGFGPGRLRIAGEAERRRPEHPGLGIGRIGGKGAVEGGDGAGPVLSCGGDPSAKDIAFGIGRCNVLGGIESGGGLRGNVRLEPEARGIGESDHPQIPAHGAVRVLRQPGQQPRGAGGGPHRLQGRGFAKPGGHPAARSRPDCGGLAGGGRIFGNGPNAIIRRGQIGGAG